MILKVIFAQRHNAYAGENAPEAMECMTEYGYDENPDWLLNKLLEYKGKGEFTNVAIIDINVSQDKIDAILKRTEIVKGEVLD